MSESPVTTKLDFDSAYWHVKLYTESCLLITFQIPYERFCWESLAFGLNVSSKIFQRKLFKALNFISGTECMVYNVVIHEKDNETCDRNLDTFMIRGRDEGIKRNPRKLELRVPEITFMGHRIINRDLNIYH